jgi:hypothetical protein
MKHVIPIRLTLEEHHVLDSNLLTPDDILGIVSLEVADSPFNIQLLIESRRRNTDGTLGSPTVNRFTIITAT